MIFSTRTALQLLVALSAVVAAPTYHDWANMLSPRELSDFNHPETRSVMFGHQKYSSGSWEVFKLVLSGRDLSPFGVRADDISHALAPHADLRRRTLSAGDRANVKKQLKRHVAGLLGAKKSVKKYKDLLKNETDPEKKANLQILLNSAKDLVGYEEEEIGNCNDLLRGRSTR
jgi:hypothetical protein